MESIRTIAVIGAGAAGRVFALRAAQAGFAVVLEDVMPAKLRRAQDEYAELISAAGSLAFVTTVEDAVRNADVAIDFVPDELESKLEIFSLLDRMAPPRTIFCTPTEAMSMTDLASCTYRSTRCVGLRGDWLGGSVGIVRSKFLDSDVAAAVGEMLTAMGVASQVVADSEVPMLVKNLVDPTLRGIA